MPTTYDKASSDVLDFAAEVMKQYHGHLQDAGVTVEYLMAASEKGPAVKLHGVACVATVRIIGLRDRAAGLADAQVVIDDGIWHAAPDARRRAIIDHELYHLELAKDKKTGQLKQDDLGRPKLKMRPHDFEVGWFDAIAERHGDESYEVRQAKTLAADKGQIYFGWAASARTGAADDTSGKYPGNDAL